MPLRFKVGDEVRTGLDFPLYPSRRCRVTVVKLDAVPPQYSVVTVDGKHAFDVTEFYVKAAKSLRLRD